MNNIQLAPQEIIITNFLSASDEEQAYRFMLVFFQNYALSVGKSNALEFGACLQEVNKLLMKPVEERVDISHEANTKKKIQIWMKAHKRFEERIRKGLVSISSNYYDGRTLFEKNSA